MRKGRPNSVQSWCLLQWKPGENLFSQNNIKTLEASIHQCTSYSHGHSTVLIFTFFVYHPSHPPSQINMIRTNELFTVLYANQSQVDNGIIKEKRSNVISSRWITFFLEFNQDSLKNLQQFAERITNCSNFDIS